MVYLSLFASAFLAATLLPATSEAYLLYLLQQEHEVISLWLVATLGNTAGAMVNYVLGRYVSHVAWVADRVFNEKQRERAASSFRKYGVWSLLFSWLPVVGDPLTFVAGLANTRWQVALVLISVGKGLRYAIFILLSHWVLTG